MSAHLVSPIHIATALAYALKKENQNQVSLAGKYIKFLISKTADISKKGVIPFSQENNYSAEELEFLIILAVNDFYDVDLYFENNINLLGEFIYKSNFASVKERYSHDKEYINSLEENPLKNLSKADLKKAQIKANELNVFEFVSMIDYIIYQCSSLTDFKNSLCSEFLNSLIYNGIRSNESYQNFAWGLDEL